MTDIIIVEDEAIAAQHLQRILQDIFEEKNENQDNFEIRNSKSEIQNSENPPRFTILQSIEETVDYFSNQAENQDKFEIRNSKSEIQNSENPKPDLVFMDFHLADGLATHIFEHTSIPCPVIFTTAYDQYALDAFRAGGIDYPLQETNTDNAGSNKAIERILLNIFMIYYFITLLLSD